MLSDLNPGDLFKWEHKEIDGYVYPYLWDGQKWIEIHYPVIFLFKNKTRYYWLDAINEIKSSQLSDSKRYKIKQ